ncbi:MAG TPA: DNA translocase FtsK, partial [Blastocatellia bacterium]
KSRKPIITRAEVFYKLPSLDLLEAPVGHQEQAEEELRARATLLAEKCKEFGVIGHIHRINPGPVVTTFEFKPDPGVKYSRVVGLTDDLCLGLQAESIRIDRIPGKSTVGIEVPNLKRAIIRLREVIDSPRFQHSESKLTVALGKTINGEEYITDLTKMPHLLIAGATGAGKSVTLNAIVCSIIYKATPDEVKFIMVDPKRVELGLYENIPHLLTPIVTDPKRAANALKWAVNEMEERYRSLASMGVRNIDQYNRQVREMTHPTVSEDDSDAPKPLPYIVIAIDELADLMMVARSEVETSIARLAQMARAVGIHLVLATQRPSVDIITGVIKANIPSRIAFSVSQKVDSRTIIDSNGAESLLGQGDMLFLPPGSARLIRVHGSFVNEDEIKAITDHTRKQAEPKYNEQVTLSEQEAEETMDVIGERDELYEEALAIVIDMGRASTSVLQRRLSIGYGRAAKILDMMEREGFIGPADGSKPRKVLSAAYEFRERIGQQIEEEDE